MDLDKLKTTAGLDLRGKRVLVRADLNVPVKDGKVADATRLERLVPGLQDLARRGARVIVISHFGRPKGGPDPQFSLKPVAAKLAELMGKPVAFAGDCIGEAAAKVAGQLKDGDIAVLENLRFHAGEEKNDPAFAKELAKFVPRASNVATDRKTCLWTAVSVGRFPNQTLYVSATKDRQPRRSSAQTTGRIAPMQHIRIKDPYRRLIRPRSNRRAPPSVTRDLVPTVIQVVVRRARKPAFVWVQAIKREHGAA
jgi:hypothetical protein